VAEEISVLEAISTSSWNYVVQKNLPPPSIIQIQKEHAGRDLLGMEQPTDLQPGYRGPWQLQSQRGQKTGSKNTEAVSRKHPTGHGVFWACQKSKGVEWSADPSSITLNPPQKTCRSFQNLLFFLPNHPCYCLSWLFSWKCM